MPPRRTRFRFHLRITLLAALWAAGVACSPSEPITPEQQIDALVEAFEQAAEEKDLSAAMEAISESYRDPEGRTRQLLKALLVRHFLAHRTLGVMATLRHVEIGEPATTARAEVLAALTATSDAEFSSLKNIDADIYRFDLELAKEADGEWRIVRAGWRPADAGDLF